MLDEEAVREKAWRKEVIAVSGLENIKEMDQTYVANTYGRCDVCFDHGKGAVLVDDKGKEYIDLGAGIAVNSLGIADEEWKKAVIEQLDKLPHTSNLYYTAPQAKLAKLMCEKTGMKKVFFSNSGAEANECAIKAARKYSNDKYGEEAGRNVIITMKNSFHGRTVTTLAATGQDYFHHHFNPFTPGFVYADPTDFASVEKLAQENKVCAIMMELIQGEGGLYVLTPEFVHSAAKLAAEKDLLIIVDEVQTGNGRTGELYAYMGYGLQPDIVSTAKGLAGGLPLGATMLNEKCKNVLTAGSHGSTFGGNPVCAAGAMNIFSRIDDALMADVKAKSEYIISELKSAPGVEGISGKGLMLGIKPVGEVKVVLDECLKKGVVVLSAKDKVRLLPALTIPMEQLKKAIAILKEVLAEQA